jgi:hypothetical protein
MDVEGGGRVSADQEKADFEADDDIPADDRCVLFRIKLLYKCFELLCLLLMP